MLPGLVEHVCRIADVDHDGSVDIDNVTGDDDEVLYRAQVAHVHGESDSRASSADTATTSQLILCKTHRRTTDKEQARRKLQHEYELLSLIHSSSVSSRDSISADTDNATSEITTMAIQHTPVVKPLRLAWHRPVQGAHGKSTVIAKSMPRPSGECDADTESDQVVLEMEDLASARTLEQLFLHSKSVGDRNLTDNRSNHRLSFAAFLSIALQLSHALDLIHDANIIHRGIQPRNILATPIADGPHSFRVKVANLGSAVYVDKRSRVPACANVRACDMPYLSPEETGRLVAKVNYRTGMAVVARKCVFH